MPSSSTSLLNAARSLALMARSICVSRSVNIVTWRVAVMILGLSGGLTGSCAETVRGPLKTMKAASSAIRPCNMNNILLGLVPGYFTKKETVRRTGRSLVASNELVGEERAAQGLVATAAAAVFPFHLDQPAVAAKGLVDVGAIGNNRRRTKLEVALVGVFLAAGVKPGVEVGVGDGFFGL